MRALLVTIALVAVCALAATDLAGQFEAFKTQYGRSYATAAEERTRFGYFAANVKRAAELSATNPAATFGINEFADMSASEFKTRHNSDKHYAAAVAKQSPVANMFTAEELATAGEKQDWRPKGAVTPVKNQGQCGSCWAFSTTGGIEGQWFMAGNKLTSLSEQELVSCDTIDSGCGGGLMDQAMEWLMQAHNGTIVTEASYPYVSGMGNVPSCNMAGTVFGAKISGHQDLPTNESQMAAWVFKNGPMSIAVDATSWQTYTSGIMSNCQSVQLDHGVLIVGFDSENQPPYWIVKNSWGKSWGEAGYIRLQMFTDQCLLTSYPTTSIIAKGPYPTPAPGAPTPTPRPTPAPPATFTQMDCSDAACSQGCVNHTFPQNTCLMLSGGGSATAYCTATQLVLTEYFSQDCSGTGMPANMPIDQCLQDQMGTYFENLCSAATAIDSGTLSRRKLLK